MTSERTYAKGQIWRSERTGVTVVLADRRPPGWRAIVVSSTDTNCPVGGFDLYWNEEHDLAEAEVAVTIGDNRDLGTSRVCITCWTSPSSRYDPASAWPYHLNGMGHRCGPVLSQSQIQVRLDIEAPAPPPIVLCRPSQHDAYEHTATPAPDRCKRCHATYMYGEWKHMCFHCGLLVSGGSPLMCPKHGLDWNLPRAVGTQ